MLPWLGRAGGGREAQSRTAKTGAVLNLVGRMASWKAECSWTALVSRSAP